MTFASRVLAVNLEKAHQVFPYVISCGTELQAWSDGLGDPLAQYWAETIKELSLGCATAFFLAEVEKTFQVGASSIMNPGSLPDWPLPQQGPLFRLLGDVTAAIGVTLSESFVMMPTKSVSGILFPTDQRLRELPALPARGVPEPARAVRSRPCSSDGTRARVRMAESDWRGEIARTIRTEETHLLLFNGHGCR